MRKILGFVVLSGALLLPGVAMADEWRVTITISKGNASTCGYSSLTKFMIIEKDNVLTLTNRTKRIVHMTVPLQPDGSASGEFHFQLSTRPDRARVTIPAGTGPRRFDLLALKEVCYLSVDPA